MDYWNFSDEKNNLRLRKNETNFELQVDFTAREVLPLSIWKPLLSKEVTKTLKEPFSKIEVI